MWRFFENISGIVLVIAVATMSGWAAEQQNGTAGIQMNSVNPARSANQREPTYMAKPLSYWLNSIRNRDQEMDVAFEAIRALGPAARAAVPELIIIVDEPFTPVQVGLDTRESIESKLLDIQVRDDAIDALASIGEAAAPSSATLIKWALSVRVVPPKTGNTEDNKLFIDLLAIDVLQRMGVAGAIAQFGDAAVSSIVDLLLSDDKDERKLAVAILNEEALPLAAALLKSDDCNKRKLGIAILVDMWSVVPSAHLIELKSAVICNPTD